MQLVSVNGRRAPCRRPPAYTHAYFDTSLRAHRDHVCVCCVRTWPGFWAWMPLTGLSSYEPASSDTAPNLEPRTNVGRQGYGPEAGGTGARGEAISPPRASKKWERRRVGKGDSSHACLSNILSQQAQWTPWPRARGWPKTRFSGHPRGLRALDAWALELIEQDWVWEEAAKPEIEK